MPDDEVVESEPEWFSNPKKVIQTTLDGRWIFKKTTGKSESSLSSFEEK